MTPNVRLLCSSSGHYRGNDPLQQQQQLVAAISPPSIVICHNRASETEAAAVTITATLTATITTTTTRATSKLSSLSFWLSPKRVLSDVLISNKMSSSSMEEGGRRGRGPSKLNYRQMVLLLLSSGINNSRTLWERTKAVRNTRYYFADRNITAQHF